jgi:hypothetical protein
MTAGGLSRALMVMGDKFVSKMSTAFKIDLSKEGYTRNKDYYYKIKYKNKVNLLFATIV